MCSRCLKKKYILALTPYRHILITCNACNMRKILTKSPTWVCRSCGEDLLLCTFSVLCTQDGSVSRHLKHMHRSPAKKRITCTNTLKACYQNLWFRKNCLRFYFSQILFVVVIMFVFHPKTLTYPSLVLSIQIL